MSLVNSKKICLFGGTGFVGSSIVRLLAKKGHQIKIATREPFRENVIEIKSTVSDPGQIKIEKININSLEQIKSFIRGSDICLNLIGILYEKGNAKFKKLHFDFVKNLIMLVGKMP